MGLALQSKSVSQTIARQKYDQNVLDKLISHIWDRCFKFNNPSSSPPDILQSGETRWTLRTMTAHSDLQETKHVRGINQ